MADLYEIKNDTVKSVMRSIAEKIGAACPTGWGYLLHIFEFGTKEQPGSTFYISNADRVDAIRMLEEWIAKQRPDGEINPDHPVTKKMHSEWHKIVALLLMRFLPDDTHFVITDAHVKRMGDRDVSVAVKEQPDGLHVFLVSTEEARKLAAEGRAEEGAM